MHNARKLIVALWLLVPWLVLAQPYPPVTRSVLTTNIPPFGLTGQALFRTTALPYLAWSNIVASGGDTVLSNYVVALSNLVWTGDNNVSNWVNAVSNYTWASDNVVSNYAGSISNLTWSGDNSVSNWVNAVSNIIATGSSGSWIKSLNGNGTNTTFYQSAAGNVPVTIIPQIGSTTNRLEIQDTNGVPKVVVDAQGRLGVGTNLPQGDLHLVSTNAMALLLQSLSGFGASNRVAFESNGLFSVSNVMVSDVSAAAAGIPGFRFSQNWVKGGGAANNISNAFLVEVFDTPKTGSNPGTGTNSDVYSYLFTTRYNGIPTFQLSKHGQVYNNFGNYYLMGSAALNQGMVWNNVSGQPICYGTNYLVVARPGFRVYQNTGIASDLFDILDTNNAIRFCIASNYFVGIGTNSPQSALHVTADNSAALIAQFGTTNQPQLVCVDTNGHFGIGTNNPQAVLDIVATNSGNGYLLRLGTLNRTGVYSTNAFSINTNGDVSFGGSQGFLYGDGGVQGTSMTGPYFRRGSSSSYASLRASDLGQFGSGFAIMTSGGQGSPSNFLWVSGQVIASNGIVAKTHSTYATNVPPLSVEPNVGQATNHLQVLGTNGTKVHIVDSNAVTQVVGGIGGILNPVGCWGNLKMSDTNIVQCPGADVYTNACGTNFTSIATNGFYGAVGPGDSAALTNLYAGWYRVEAWMSYTGANATSYEVGIFTNLVECTELEWKDTFDTPARARGNSLGGTIYLPAGCRTSLKIKDYGTGSSVSVTRVSLNIGTP